jgi:long-chain-fatty-acid--CoA ligase ACSBG
LAETLREVRPTTFFGVPRVWEKIYEKMQAIGKQTTGIKKTIATWLVFSTLNKYIFLVLRL